MLVHVQYGLQTQTHKENLPESVINPKQTSQSAKKAQPSDNQTVLVNTSTAKTSPLSVSEFTMADGVPGESEVSALDIDWLAAPR